MTRTLLLGVAVTIALAGCDDSDAAKDKAPFKVPASPTKSLKDLDPVAYENSVPAAVAEVPPHLQLAFQKLLVCQVKQNNAGGTPRPIDGAYIRELATHLKANPTAGDTCPV